MQLPKRFQSVQLQDKGTKITSVTFPEKFEPNTVVLKPLLIGVCQSDLKELAGTRRTRSDFGHEFVARVVLTNAKTSLCVGDHVILDPHIPVTRGSGFSEYLIATGKPEDLPRAFLRITGSDHKKMALTEPLACAHHCIERLKIYLGRRTFEDLSIAIVGAGTFGTLIGLLAKHFGASVTVYNRSNDKLQFLKQRGLFKKTEVKTFDEKAKKTYDVVIPTTSFLFPEVMKQTTALVKDEGLVLLFGGTSPEDKLPESSVDIDIIRRQEKVGRIFYNNKFFRIAGSYGAKTEDFLAAIELLENATSTLPVEKFINNEFAFENIVELFAKMQKEPIIGKNIVLFKD